MKRNYSLQRGFTLTELMVVLGIVGILISVTIGSLNTSQRKTSVTVTTSQLVSELKQQQLKAMVGDMEGGGTASDYGIYFSGNTYTLFKGTTYVPSDPSNFTVTLENTLQINSDTPSLVFSKVSGEISSYSATANTITLQDTVANEQNVLHFNAYGVVTAVN